MQNGTDIRTKVGGVYAPLSPHSVGISLLVLKWVKPFFEMIMNLCFSWVMAENYESTQSGNDRSKMGVRGSH